MTPRCRCLANFFCSARQHGQCDSRHIPVHEVEDAVLRHYRTVRLSAEFIDWVQKSIDNVLADQKQEQNALRSQLNTRLAQLSRKADNLVDLVAEGGIVSAKAAARIREIEEQKRRRAATR